jgi:hypothetical protein
MAARELSPEVEETPGRGFWIGLALGLPVMAYGAVELFGQAGSTRATNVAVWIGGGLLLHDLLFAPVVITAVWAIGKVLPERLRAPIRAGVLGTALVIAIGWPALRGYGNRPDNRTIHPLDYTTAVLTAMAVVWALVGAWVLVAAIDRRRRRPGG